MKKKEIIEIIKERRENGRYGRRQIAMDFNMSERQATNLINELQTKNNKMTVGITEEQLRAKFDNKFIVAHAVNELVKGIFLSHAEFVQKCKFASNAGYKDAIEHPEFEEYHGKAGGIVYWSHPDSIKKLKDEAVLK